jgi:hypothetical protein
MPLTMPLDLADFFEELCPISTTFQLGEAVIVNETGGGEVIRSDYGSRLWQGTVTLAPAKPVAIEDIMALVRVLQDSRASFLIYPRHKKRPTGGGALSEPIGQINSLPTNNRLISLKGLPANYVITRGDFLSFIYSSSPARYAFHQAVETITAGGLGVTGQFEVIPPIRPGAVVDTGVQFNRARLKAVMVPGSLTVSELPKRGFAAGATFTWQQTLR